LWPLFIGTLMLVMINHKKSADSRRSMVSGITLLLVMVSMAAAFIFPIPDPVILCLSLYIWRAQIQGIVFVQVQQAKYFRLCLGDAQFPGDGLGGKRDVLQHIEEVAVIGVDQGLHSSKFFFAKAGFALFFCKGSRS